MKIKMKCWDKTTKYGMKLHKSVDQANKLNRANVNTLWIDALTKEIKTVR